MEELSEVISTKVYAPGRAPSFTPAWNQQPSARPQLQPQLPSPSSYGSYRVAPRGRKRSFGEVYPRAKRDWNHDWRHDRYDEEPRRAAPQYGSRGDYRVSSVSSPSASGLLPLDTRSPLAKTITMQAMGVPFPGPTQIPTLASPLSQAPPHERSKALCRDYDTRGVCARGLLCPFMHVDSTVMVSGTEEYDPVNAALLDRNTDLATLFRQQTGRNARQHVNSTPIFPPLDFTPLDFTPLDDHPPARRRPTHQVYTDLRSSIAPPGPNYDVGITSIVVHNIPAEHRSIEAVRSFFSQFGNVEDVSLNFARAQVFKRPALVKFTDFASAKAAYDSPKAMFDNRFVKVLWYRPSLDLATDRIPASPLALVTEQAKHDNGLAKSKDSKEWNAFSTHFDRVTWEESASAAQKRLEERKKLQKDTDAKLKEIAEMRTELGRRRLEELKRLENKIRAKRAFSNGANGIANKSVVKGIGSDVQATRSQQDTEALRAILRDLEDEAKMLGIDPDRVGEENSFYSSRGRGAYRGAYRGRGRGWSPYPHPPHAIRGSSSTRGGLPFRGVVHGGGKYNLDLRPKRVLIKPADAEVSWTWNDETDEALRTHLFSIGECEGIELVNGDSRQGVVIVFEDRATAEAFFYGEKEVRGLGKVGVSWVRNGADARTADKYESGDVVMGGADAGGDAFVQADEKADDYDVAEEDERWIVT